MQTIGAQAGVAYGAHCAVPAATLLLSSLAEKVGSGDTAAVFALAGIAAWTGKVKGVFVPQAASRLSITRTITVRMAKDG
jgi:hypothetical protein